MPECNTWRRYNHNFRSSKCASEHIRIHSETQFCSDKPIWNALTERVALQFFQASVVPRYSNVLPLERIWKLNFLFGYLKSQKTYRDLLRCLLPASFVLLLKFCSAMLSYDPFTLPIWFLPGARWVSSFCR